MRASSLWSGHFRAPFAPPDFIAWWPFHNPLFTQHETVKITGMWNQFLNS
jgi:hypothetical protein